MERGRVGHKGAAPALGSNQTLINEHLKGMAYGAARQPRFVHEFHLGRQLVSARVGAGVLPVLRFPHIACFGCGIARQSVELYCIVEHSTELIVKRFQIHR